MKTNLDKFKTVKDYDQNGVWFEISDEIAFRVRSFSTRNPTLSPVMARIHKPHAQQIKLKTLSEEKAAELMIEILAEACIVDWKGIEIDGVVTPYSIPVCCELLKDNPVIADTLFKYAQDEDNYREEKAVQDVGNS